MKNFLLIFTINIYLLNAWGASSSSSLSAVWEEAPTNVSPLSESGIMQKLEDLRVYVEERLQEKEEEYEKLKSVLFPLSPCEKGIFFKEITSMIEWTLSDIQHIFTSLVEERNTAQAKITLLEKTIEENTSTINRLHATLETQTQVATNMEKILQGLAKGRAQDKEDLAYLQKRLTEQLWENEYLIQKIISLNQRLGEEVLP